MTLAVQGEWGSGKTSLMNFVAEDLKRHQRVAAVIEFNTWEMAFLDSGPILTVALMQKILDKIPVTDQDKRAQILETLAKVAALRTLELAPSLVGAVAPNEILAKAVEKGAAAAAERINGPKLDLPQQVLAVRKSFGDEVAGFLARQEQGARLVVLVDDLDRLPPHRAVELMESLKSIMDCEGCVFVLAVDFDVVVQGIKQKYPDMTEDKGRSFFDKLVQVPFRMPSVKEATIRALVEDALSGETPDDLKFYTRICWLASGGNPRTAKRVINSFVLMGTIAAGMPDPTGATRSVEETPHGAADEAGASVEERLLFCLQALHVGFPAVSGNLDGDAAGLKAATEAAIEEAEATEDTDPQAQARLAALLHVVSDLVGSADGATLAEVTQLASTTSVRPAGQGATQDHSPNADVQHVIAHLFDRFAIAGAGGEPAPKGEPNAVACFDQTRVSAGGYTITHLRRTRGRGQGLNFFIGREGMPPVTAKDVDDKAQKIYISGDRAGRLPNDGFSLIGTRIRYEGMKNGAFDAAQLRRDPARLQEFEDAVIEGLNELVRRFASLPTE